MNRTRRLYAAVAVAGTLAISAPAVAGASVITISGATASAPLVSLLAHKYVKVKKHVTIKIAQGGANVGIADVAADRVSLADVSRDPLPSDPGGLVFYPIAKYFVCVVTNLSNPLTNLTQAQAQAIFTGKVRDWSQVPGASAHGTIDLISRTSVAGVLTTFQQLLLGNKTVSSIADQEPSEGLLQQKVKSDPNAIGFLSDYFALRGVNPVGFGGVGCSVANAVSGQYPGVAHFYEVTRGKATGPGKAFISWIQHSSAARKIIASSWIPLH
ncbi:MAG TPA: substrate-binding domain-containing protein [Solirubrobacteraceae bacterium]|nr:substrate-binding domain-containing protein [Solirubrobacteraceae bacterium]